jgi:hypothetical protein
MASAAIAAIRAAPDGRTWFSANEVAALIAAASLSAGSAR